MLGQMNYGDHGDVTTMRLVLTTVKKNITYILIEKRVYTEHWSWSKRD